MFRRPSKVLPKVARISISSSTEPPIDPSRNIHTLHSEAKFTNKAGAPIHGMNLQCAVPKYISMEMQPPSSTTIALGSNNVTQKIKVTNSMFGKKNLMMKVKLSFTVNGQKFEHMSTCSSFPSGY